MALQVVFSVEGGSSPVEAVAVVWFGLGLVYYLSYLGFNIMAVSDTTLQSRSSKKILTGRVRTAL